MSWQSWACNELNQAVTHPSPYANVYKNNMCTMGGTIGLNGNDTWTPYTNDVHAKHAKKVDAYLKTLSPSLNITTRHSKMLEFLAENGMRQVGEPRIGIFAERVRPDPLHCEVNAWQHLLDLIYSESICRNVFDKFIKITSAHVGLENRNVGDNLDPITGTVWDHLDPITGTPFDCTEDTLSEIVIPPLY